MSNLEELKLEKFRSFLPNYLEEINNNNINFTDALLKLTEKEIEFKNERASKIQIAVSAFPFEKTLNDFELIYASYTLLSKSFFCLILEHFLILFKITYFLNTY